MHCSCLLVVFFAHLESEIKIFDDDCVCYREIKNKEDTLKVQKDNDGLGS